MRTQTLEGATEVLIADPDNTSDSTTTSDPFDFDINFVEGVDASETVLMCSTSDNCGSSCGSACTTS